MTELGELLSMALSLDAETEKKCPFCGNPPHGFGTDKKKKQSDVVKSIPKNLGCDSIEGGTGKPPLRYTTAAHHLICAKQCYAMVKVLVRMGSLVGYDINSKPNGMPLPTVRNKYYRKNFGDLSDEADPDSAGLSQQDIIAFQIMEELGAQWHVGHHSFEIKIVEYDVDEGGEDSEYLHTTSYDCEVLERLLDIAVLCQNIDLCKDDSEKESFKQKMDALSEEIASYLKKFAKGSSPMDSKPYFVSDRAYKYASNVEDGTWKKWKRSRR